MQKIIEFADKVALNENAEIPETNKITDDNINEIKSVVNGSLQGTNAMGSIVVDDVKCKNMFNPYSVIANAGVNNGVIFSTNDYDIYVVKVVPTKKYTISKTSNNAGLIGYYSTFPAIGNTITNMQTLRDITTLTITAQDNYLCIMIAKADNIDTIQVEPGDTATSYTPYKAFATEYKWDIIQNQDVVFTNSTQFFSIQNINKYDRIRVAVNNSYNRTSYFYFEKNDLIGNSNLFQTLLSMPNGELASLALGRITLDVVNDAIGVVYDKSNATFPLTLKNIVGYYRGEQTSSSTSGTRSITPTEEETR